MTNLSFIIIIAITLALDQLVKWWVRSEMMLGESIPILQNVFHLTYIENPGAAFGMFKDKTLFFVIFTLIIIGVMVYLYLHQANRKTLFSYSLALVIGGALGNLVDRMVKGTVTDMFDFRIWPVLNIADMAVVIGLIYLAYCLIFRGEDYF